MLHAFKKLSSNINFGYLEKCGFTNYFRVLLYEDDKRFLSGCHPGKFSVQILPPNKSQNLMLPFLSVSNVFCKTEEQKRRDLFYFSKTFITCPFRKSRLITVFNKISITYTRLYVV